MLNGQMRKECPACGKPIHIRGLRNHMQFKHPNFVKRGPGRPKGTLKVTVVNAPVAEPKHMRSPIVASARDVVFAAKATFGNDVNRQLAFVMMITEPVTSENLLTAAEYLKVAAEELK